MKKSWEKEKKNGKPIIDMRMIFPATAPNVNTHKLNEIIFRTRLKSVTPQRSAVHCGFIFLVRADVGAMFVCSTHVIIAQLCQVNQERLKYFSTVFLVISLKCASFIPLNIVAAEDDENDNEKKLKTK